MGVFVGLSEWREALGRCGLDLADEPLGRVAEYARRLWEWNERINLTRHTTLDRFVGRDLLDSVRLAECLAKDERIVDLGSGGGVPGILIAILRPDVRVELCECVGKKARILAAMCDELGIERMVHADKIERILARPGPVYDSVVARGVGSLSDLLGMIGSGWERVRRLLAIKGPKWVEERGAARHVGLLRACDLRRIATYGAPGAEWESVILQVTRRTAEPSSESGSASADRASCQGSTGSS